MSRPVPASQLAPLLAANAARKARMVCLRGGHTLAIVGGQKRCRICHNEAVSRHRARQRRARAAVCARAFPHLAGEVRP